MLKKPLRVAGKEYQVCALEGTANISRLPYALKILLENLLRYQDNKTVRAEDIAALVNWDPKAAPHYEIVFRPGRVLLQDFTGVPVIVDLAAMRDAIVKLGGQATRINPLSPVDLVIDHSVTVESYAEASAFEKNTRIEFAQNQERYRFLRWGQRAFENFRVVPPGTGIVHQVNLEYLAQVVCDAADGTLYPDTVVGTDSHTTMINGLGVLGWGVGGIEAEAAMLGQPIPLLIPEVVGFRLTGALREGATATDLVLVIVEQLRKHGVVGKFVEFFGAGLQHIPVADRATIANMAPEYGATCGLFPIDAETLKFLTLTGRDPARIALVEAYARAQGFFHTPDAPEAVYSSVLELDLASVVPSIAGPKRPQDRIALTESKHAFERALALEFQKTPAGQEMCLPCPALGKDIVLKQGAVLIAAITSCTNTSNPAVMLAAGLLAKKAAARGLRPKPWVKTSLAPGSQVVTDYLNKAGVMASLEALGFYLVGYGCTTCIGNSGPLADPIRDVLKENPGFVGAAVLSGNRNFEGRIHPQVRYAYLASPPLVVAYALAGTMDIDWYKEAIGQDSEGKAVYLQDIWPTQAEIQATIESAISPALFTERYSAVFEGAAAWKALPIAEGALCAWDDTSTYVKHPPYFEGMTNTPAPLQDIAGARVLAVLGDSVTTDHISPAGSIGVDSPAGKYLRDLGVEPSAFNSYGSRRGNHEVMVRGTFANIRLRNQLANGKEGGFTRYLPTQTIMSIYEAAMAYQATHTPLIVLAGKEYGTGSSRDWAAKGVHLLGVSAVIAESFERIHRSNLIGMGVLPLEFMPGQSATTLGLSGEEVYQISLADLTPKKVVHVHYQLGDKTGQFEAQLRIDTLIELEYFRHGGILQYVLRQLAAQ